MLGTLLLFLSDALLLTMSLPKDKLDARTSYSGLAAFGGGTRPERRFAAVCGTP